MTFFPSSQVVIPSISSNFFDDPLGEGLGQPTNSSFGEWPDPLTNDSSEEWLEPLPDHPFTQFSDPQKPDPFFPFFEDQLQGNKRKYFHSEENEENGAKKQRTEQTPSTVLNVRIPTDHQPEHFSAICLTPLLPELSVPFPVAEAPVPKSPPPSLPFLPSLLSPIPASVTSTVFSSPFPPSAAPSLLSLSTSVKDPISALADEISTTTRGIRSIAEAQIPQFTASLTFLSPQLPSLSGSALLPAPARPALPLSSINRADLTEQISIAIRLIAVAQVNLIRVQEPNLIPQAIAFSQVQMIQKQMDENLALLKFLSSR